MCREAGRGHKQHSSRARLGACHASVEVLPSHSFGTLTKPTHLRRCPRWMRRWSGWWPWRSRRQSCCRRQRTPAVQRYGCLQGMCSTCEAQALAVGQAGEAGICRRRRHFRQVPPAAAGACTAQRFTASGLPRCLPHLEHRLGGASRHPGEALYGVGQSAHGKKVGGQQEGADLQAAGMRGGAVVAVGRRA